MVVKLDYAFAPGNRDGFHDPTQPCRQSFEIYIILWKSSNDCIVTHEGRYYLVSGQVVVLSEDRPRQTQEFVSAVHRNPTNGNWLLVGLKVYSAEPVPL